MLPPGRESAKARQQRTGQDQLRKIGKKEGVHTKFGGRAGGSQRRVEDGQPGHAAQIDDAKAGDHGPDGGQVAPIQPTLHERPDQKGRHWVRQQIPSRRPEQPAHTGRQPGRPREDGQPGRADSEIHDETGRAEARPQDRGTQQYNCRLEGERDRRPR